MGSAAEEPMKEETARKVVWLAAIQEIAGVRSVLPARLPKAGAEEGEWCECFDSVAARVPRLLELHKRTRVPAWMGHVLPWLAFFLGLLAETLPSGGRVNLIAIPVLSLIVWNVAVYVCLLAGVRGNSDAHAAGGFRGWLAERGEALTGAAVLSSGDDWGRARRSFLHRWFNHARPLLMLRIEVLLHTAAAAAMLGLVAGMYLRGLGFEYRAGWSSTFLDGQSLRLLLNGVLGPAAWVSGLEVPSVGHLEQLAWARNPAGENAAEWIHLYAITAVLYVGLPRLVLAFIAARRASKMRSDFPIDLAGLALSDTGGASMPVPLGRRVRVLPFNVGLDAKDCELLRLYASGEAEGPVQLDVGDKIDYSGIEEYVENFTAEAGVHAHAVVFNLATTPEAEVQGMLLAGLRDRVSRLWVYLDGAAFTARFSGEPNFSTRMAGRRELWIRFLEQYALKPIFLRAET